MALSTNEISLAASSFEVPMFQNWQPESGSKAFMTDMKMYDGGHALPATR